MVLGSDKLRLWAADGAYFRFVEVLPTQGTITFILRFDVDSCSLQTV